MSVAKFILLGWYAVSVLVTIATVGKPRKPLEPIAAAVAVTITGLLAWLVVIA